MAKRKNPNKAKGSKPSAVDARQKEDRAVKLRLDGWSLVAIAKEIGYAGHAGARCAVMRALARLPRPENVEALRTREIALMDEIEREAMEQWRRSTEDATSRTEAETKDGVMVTEKVEGQSGNPALLEKAIKASERRAKLLGLDAPQRVSLEKEKPLDLFGQDPAQWAAERLNRIAGIRSRIPVESNGNGSNGKEG